MAKLKLMLCAAVVVLTSAGLRADTFTFSYTATAGGPVTASGTINANQFVDAWGLQAFAVTSIYGDRNGSLISPPSGGGVFYWGPNVFGQISFTVTPPGSMDIVNFTNGTYTEAGAFASSGVFSISRSMPEPATLGAFLTMGLGALVLARKLPSNKRV